MTNFFSAPEASLIVRLLIAHCITDFFLQPDHWVKDKLEKVFRSKYLYLHITLTAFAAWLLAWELSWWHIAIIAITHLLIDGGKLWLQKNRQRTTNLTLFLADQFLHLVILVLVWLLFIDGFESFDNMLHHLVTDYSISLKMLGYLVVTGPVGFIIHFATRKWTTDLTPNDSLRNAGKWIGILERLLILTMVYINQFAAIGFIVAAKSILRLTDKPDKPTPDPTMGRPFSSRKHTEYVLIGTFLSVGIALAVGLLINYLS